MKNGLILLAVTALLAACGGPASHYKTNPYMGTQDPHGNWNVKFAGDPSGVQSQGGFFVNADGSYGFTYASTAAKGMTLNPHFVVEATPLARSGSTFTGTAGVATETIDVTTGGGTPGPSSSAAFSATLDASGNVLTGTLGATSFTAVRDSCWPGDYFCPLYVVP